ncbi:MAG: helix-turn-helix domain-containing protein [Nitrososphaerota archaeon]
MKKTPIGRRKSTSHLPVEEFEYIEDFGKIIREAREKIGLTQEDLARQLNERITVIKKIESGEFKPPVDLARKIEKLLKIVIIVPAEEELEDLSRYLEKGETSKSVSLGLYLRKSEEKVGGA